MTNVYSVAFVSAFAIALSVVAATVLFALRRAALDLHSGRAQRIRWHEDFTALPARDRVCRHELTGEVADRTCANRFDCRACKDHASFRARAASSRSFHRGHTYVDRLEDGTLAIGLDEFATRLVGRPDALKLPALGTSLETNGTAWRMKKNGIEVRVLSPVDGEVVATGGPDDPWYLRVQPASNDFRHLLTPAEAEVWLRRQSEHIPQKWDELMGRVFLEP